MLKIFRHSTKTCKYTTWVYWISDFWRTFNSGTGQWKTLFQANIVEQYKGYRMVVESWESVQENQSFPCTFCARYFLHTYTKMYATSFSIYAEYLMKQCDAMKHVHLSQQPACQIPNPSFGYLPLCEAIFTALPPTWAKVEGEKPVWVPIICSVQHVTWSCIPNETKYACRLVQLLW